LKFLKKKFFEINKFFFKKSTKTEYEAEDEYKILIEKLNKICQPNDIFKVNKSHLKPKLLLIPNFKFKKIKK